LGESARLGLRAGLFDFQDLPSQVAFDSFTQGNLVDPSIPESSYFLTSFRGYNAGADIEAHVAGPLAIRLGADYLHNTEAPSKYADGLLVFSEGKWSGAKWVFVPRFEYFRNERQSSPAFYNSADYGHNNRHGFSYEFKMARADQGFAVKGRYTDAALIETDASQANSKIFMVYLEISK
jgi:hypothetical protein